jgi:Flavodoxin-like fold
MKFLTPRFVGEITHGHHQWRWKRKPYKTSEVSGGRPVLENRLALVAVVLRTEDKPLAVSTYGWSTPLRVFLLYANPVVASFWATLHKQVVTTLRSGGHEMDDCDLYAESFNPVMGEQERVQYHNVELNRAPIAAYADRLLAAEALVLVYPV